MRQRFARLDAAVAGRAVRLTMSKAELVFVTILVVFGTALAPLVADDQRNYLVIAYAMLAVPTMFLVRLRPGRDVAWAGVAVGYTYLVTFFSQGGIDNLTSVLYTTLLGASYLALVGTLGSRRISAELAAVTLRRMLFLYAGVSIAQFIASQTGLPVPNAILSKGDMSYNSLAVEPSHAVRFLSMTFVAYIFVSHGGKSVSLFDLFRLHKKVLVAFIISASLTGSALATIAIPLSILLTLPIRSQVLGFVTLALLWPSLSNLDIESVQRAIAFLTALPDLDARSLAEADQSASLRVMPILIYLDKLTVSDPGFWFGAGPGAIRAYIEGELIGTTSVMAGFWPGYMISFGMIGTALFLLAFVLRFFGRSTYPIIILWVFLFSTSAWNVQFFWYGLMLIRILHHFRRRAKHAHSVVAANALPPSAYRGRKA
jgi:hypothetical protein